MPVTKKATASTKPSLSFTKPDASANKQGDPGSKASPPLPPASRRSVAHLVTQLQGQMAHHSGYVPEGGVLMALHHCHMVQNHKHKQSTEPSGTPLMGRRLIWDRLRQGKATNKDKTFHGVTVRLLDESEW